MEIQIYAEGYHLKNHKNEWWYTTLSISLLCSTFLIEYIYIYTLNVYLIDNYGNQL